MVRNYQQYCDQYSMIKLRATIARAVNEYSYSALSKESGVSRSTLYKIVDGSFADVALSTAQKIMIGIVKLKRKKSLDKL